MPVAPDVNRVVVYVFHKITFFFHVYQNWKEYLEQMSRYCDFKLS